MIVMDVAEKQEATFKDPWKTLLYKNTDISDVSLDVLRSILKFTG